MLSLLLNGRAVLSAGGFAIVLLDTWKSDPLAGKDIEQACVSWIGIETGERAQPPSCGCLYPATPVAAENIVTSLLGTPPSVSFCLCFL